MPQADNLELLERQEPEHRKKRKKQKKIQEKFANAKVLECLLCFRRYSQNDVLEGNYQLETWICSACYATKQNQPHFKSCFGKPTYRLKGRKREWGFNPHATECASICPDRNICRRCIVTYPEDFNDAEQDGE